MSRNVHLIVEDQVRRWQALQNERAKARTVDHALQPNVITVSEAYGARGHSIASRTAAILKLPVYDREIVEHIATNQHVRVDTVQALDERAQNKVDAYLIALLQEHNFDQSAYFQELVRTIIAIWHHGPCVIVGRGATHVVPAAHALSVRFTAPEAARLRRCEDVDQLSRVQAKRHVARTDAEREAFVRRLYGRNINDPLNYDLMVNTEGFSTEACARMVADAYRNKFSPEFQGIPSERL